MKKSFALFSAVLGFTVSLAHAEGSHAINTRITFGDSIICNEGADANLGAYRLEDTKYDAESETLTVTVSTFICQKSGDKMSLSPAALGAIHSYTTHTGRKIEFWSIHLELLALDETSHVIALTPLDAVSERQTVQLHVPNLAGKRIEVLLRKHDYYQVPGVPKEIISKGVNAGGSYFISF